MRPPRIVVCSSSLLTDRKLAFSSFAPAIADRADVSVWAASGAGSSWAGSGLRVEPLPESEPLAIVPWTMLRRVVDAAWDRRLRPVARLSFRRHRRAANQRLRMRAMRPVGAVVGAVGLHVRLERWLIDRVAAIARCDEADRRLAAERPDLVVVTGPHRALDPPVAAAARRAGIPVAVVIESFDNLSTKDRPVFRADAWLVWSPAMAAELVEVHPDAAAVPVVDVGVAQFDALVDQSLGTSRADWCARHGLDAARPVAVWAMGSPNLFDERPAIDGLRRALDPHVQVFVRPHPMFDDAVATPRFERSLDAGAVDEWVDAFRHADVVVNLSSTAAVDAAVVDTPIVNLDFDPGGDDHAFVREVNRTWPHFSRLVATGGMAMAASQDELVAAVRAELAEPAARRAGRAAMVELVAGTVDGRAGARLADALVTLAQR